jgi:ABC-type transporter MlaC component
MSKKLFSLLLLVFFFSSSVLFADESTILPTAKKLVGFIRFKKNDQAIALIDTKTFSKNLLLNHWDKIDPKDQLEFEEAMKEYIKNKSFQSHSNTLIKLILIMKKQKSKEKKQNYPLPFFTKVQKKLPFPGFLQKQMENFWSVISCSQKENLHLK